jgi:hypothetical protein
LKRLERGNLRGRGQGTMGDTVEAALNAFAITFEGRLVPSTTN